MLRTRSAASVLLPKKAFVVAAAGVVMQVRHYEYPGINVTGRAPLHTLEGGLDKTYEKGCVAQRDSAAAAYTQTGNVDSVVYDESNIYDVHADVAKCARKFALMRGDKKYVLDDVKPKQVETALQLFDKADKTAVWAKLLADFPSAVTPFDADTQDRILKAVRNMIAKAMEATECAAIAGPLVRELLEREGKQVALPYWWRIQEYIVAEMVNANVSHGTYHSRTAHLVTERVFKILYNTINDLPWASDDLVSPLYFDVNPGARQCLENPEFFY